MEKLTNLTFQIQSRKFLSVLGERVAVSSSPPKCQECQCLKGDMRMSPTCFKCFGNSVFFVTHTDTVAEDLVKVSVKGIGVLMARVT